ncbi:MAG: (deoxy)nucleoside triphosphate pyrophosphohydrolase [Deltaproteobacteria bacterium]|nr:(deoxy)nucleoside triphosphate pyrophosphohydrolase [Deltaproteobacteria bacterium]
MNRARGEGDPKPRKIVVAALVEQDGKVLVTRRRTDGAMGGLWEFPGGKVEPGENPRAALVREIREELGVEIGVGKPVDVVHHIYEAFELLMIVFECVITRGEVSPLEVAEARFVPRRELTALEFLPADVGLVDALANGRL